MHAVVAYVRLIVAAILQQGRKGVMRRAAAPAVVVLAVLVAPAGASHGAGTVGDDQADAVWGQFGSFATTGVNQSGTCNGTPFASGFVSACSLNDPWGMGFDP